MSLSYIIYTKHQKYHSVNQLLVYYIPQKYLNFNSWLCVWKRVYMGFACYLLPVNNNKYVFKSKKNWKKGIEMLVGRSFKTYLDFELHTAGCNLWWAVKPKVNEWMTQPVHIRYTVQSLLTDKIRSVLISKRSFKLKINYKFPLNLPFLIRLDIEKITFN